MPQVQKAAVREAILHAANERFKSEGFNDTSMTQIAVSAGISTANIYRYFGSKLEIFIVIYEPWLDKRLGQLHSDLKVMPHVRQRLELILYTFWRDIPKEDNNFANNFMQALSSASSAEGYTRGPFIRTRKRVAAMLLIGKRPTLANRRKTRTIAHLLLMAFDGFVMNFRLNGAPKELDAMVTLTARMLERSLNTESG